MFVRSLDEGHLPASEKQAIVFLTIQKSNLDPHICLNFGPISNLTFISQTVERLVAARLFPYLELSGVLPHSQSGFRRHYSMETVHLSLLSDIYLAIVRSRLMFLALFDVYCIVFNYFNSAPQQP